GIFTGAAANPPPDGSMCPDDAGANGIGTRPDAGEGCAFTNIKPNFNCFQNSDCSQFGAGFFCRQVKDDPNCAPKDPDGGDAATNVPVDGAVCRGHSVCGQVVCPTDNLANRCNQVELCGPYPDFDAGGPDPISNLDAEAFNPSGLFEAGVPDGAL